VVYRLNEFMTESSEGGAKNKREIVLVCGMHRSGTSAFTRVSNLLGGRLPEPLVEPALGNELGHWEPAEVVAMNDRALLAADNDVNSIFPLAARWSQSEAARDFTAEVARYVSGLSEGGAPWFIKDPRISVLADLWRAGVRQAGSPPRFVIVFRNPWEVATSLAARQLHHFPDEVWPLERGLALWLRYVLTVERQSRGCPRSFVSYEGFLSDWRGEAFRVHDQIGLEAPTLDGAAESAIAAFLKPDQRHARHETLQTHAGLAMQVYDLLLARLADPDGGRAAFDGARQAYLDALDVVGGYTQALEGRAAAFGPLRAAAEQDRQAADEQKRAAEAAERTLLQMSRRLTEAEADQPLEADAHKILQRLKAKHEALKDAHRDNLEAYAARNAAYVSELAALQDQVFTLAGDLAERDERIVEAQGDMSEARAAYEEIRLEASAMRARIAELEQGLAGATHDFHIARRDLDLIHRSRSWRITAPLRSVLRRLGRQ
jgi:hypothetical protein